MIIRWIKGWLFYMLCLFLSGLCLAKKYGIFILGTRIMTVGWYLFLSLTLSLSHTHSLSLFPSYCVYLSLHIIYLSFLCLYLSLSFPSYCLSLSLHISVSILHSLTFLLSSFLSLSNSPSFCIFSPSYCISMFVLFLLE